MPSEILPTIRIDLENIVLKESEKRMRNIIWYGMVSFVRQLGWATRCPGIWIDVISGGWVRVLLDEASI